MASGRALTRESAARLLGVAPDAGAAEIKRAFRLWAAWTHPDQGGSAERFAELRAARDRLLEPVQVPGPSSGGARAGTDRVAHGAGAATAHEIPLRPRQPWRQVLVRPGGPVAWGLALGYVITVASVLLAGPAPLLALPAALASTAWCIAVSRVVLRGADHGHVIVTRALAWAVATGGQWVLASLAGISLIEVLPLLAVPFVAAIAAVNPAAGLWRGARR